MKKIVLESENNNIELIFKKIVLMNLKEKIRCFFLNILEKLQDEFKLYE